MRSARAIFTCLALLAALSLSTAAGAMAAGCGGSAGDSQYVDPLAGCGGSGGTSTHPATTPARSPNSTGSAARPTPVASSAASQSTISTTAPASSGASTGAAGANGKTLPYTGFDVVPLLIAGLALIGGGLGLRRLTRPRA